MSEHEHAHFNANRIFLQLFILTALEVGWSFLPLSKVPLWGGLLVFAFWKGALIFSYFMHFKFEGWVVKCLIAPTPVLVAVVIFALLPDVGSNDRMDHSITDQADPVTGEIVIIGSRDQGHGSGGHGEEEGGGP